MVLPVVFAAASLIISGLSFVVLLAYIRRRTGARRILEDFEEEVNRLIDGIDAATDRNITLLEDRSAAIKSMLETLDRRMAAYARELERREKQETALDTLASGDGALRRSQGARTENAYTALGRGLRSSLQVDPQAPPVAPPDGAGRDGPAEPDGAAGTDAAEPRPRFIRSANPVKPKTPLAEQARELYRNGFSPETIAVRLGSTQAEVNLALALSDWKEI
jgi:predicted transcriptional regulator